MSEPIATPPVSRFAKVAGPLVKEYAQRLNALIERDSQLRAWRFNNTMPTDINRSSVELDMLSQFFRRVYPAAKQLAQMTSQQLEHANLDELARLELTLWLADLENALMVGKVRFEEK